MALKEGLKTLGVHYVLVVNSPLHIMEQMTDVERSLPEPAWSKLLFPGTPG